MSDGSIMYLKELRTKKAQLKERIKELELQTKNPKEINSEFMQKYSDLNNIRVNLEAVKSRIRNYGKPRPGIEEFTIHEIKTN